MSVESRGGEGVCVGSLDPLSELLLPLVVILLGQLWGRGLPTHVRDAASRFLVARDRNSTGPNAVKWQFMASGDEPA